MVHRKKSLQQPFLIIVYLFTMLNISQVFFFHIIFKSYICRGLMNIQPERWTNFSKKYFHDTLRVKKRGSFQCFRKFRKNGAF